jgi:dihydrofolate synthase/folylpolyglutamate synthase
MAFEHFARTRPDMVVLEVGMGGRLDATNVVEPRLSIITDISLDHQKYLGDTVGEIAHEKAGILRRGGIAITLPQLPEANDGLGNTILELGARAVDAVPYVPAISGQWPVASGQLDRRQRYPLEVMGTRIMVESPLVGRHQMRNLALAIAAAVELRKQDIDVHGMNQITAETIAQGIRETRWPGRFQVLPSTGDEPEYVFDVAHNPAGAWALRATLSDAYLNSDESGLENGREITMVFGVMRDKAVKEITEILFPLAGRVIVTHADSPRSAGPDEIRLAAARVAAGVTMEEAEDVASALERARKVAGARGLVVVTGSIYIVGEAMRILGARI